MVSDCIGGKKSKNKQTSSASKACWIFFMSLQFLIGQEAYFSLNQHRYYFFTMSLSWFLLATLWIAAL